MDNLDKLEKYDFSLYQAKPETKVNNNKVKKVRLPNLKQIELSSHIKSDVDFRMRQSAYRKTMQQGRARMSPRQRKILADSHSVQKGVPADVYRKGTSRPYDF